MIAMNGSRGMLAVASKRMDKRRDMDATRRRDGEVRRHNEPETQFRPCKFTVLYFVVDDNVVRPSGNWSWSKAETTKPFEKQIRSSLHCCSSLGNWRRTRRDDLKALAIVQLDRLLALALVARAVMAFNPDQVMRCRVLVRELPDDVVGRHFVVVGLVPLAVNEKMNLVVMSVRRLMLVRIVVDTAGFSTHLCSPIAGLSVPNKGYDCI
jgi:hypothetical protein